MIGRKNLLGVVSALVLASHAIDLLAFFRRVGELSRFFSFRVQVSPYVGLKTNQNAR